MATTAAKPRRAPTTSHPQPVGRTDPWLTVPGLAALAYLIISWLFQGRFGLGSFTNLLPNDWRLLPARTVAFGIIELVLIVCCSYSLWLQLKGLKVRHPKVYKAEALPLLLMGLIPAVFIIIGDRAGALHFHDAAELGVSNIIFILLFALASVAILFCMGNALLFISRGATPMKVLGVIVYGIIWIAVAVISFFGYNVMYSLHDPSTE